MESKDRPCPMLEDQRPIELVTEVSESGDFRWWRIRASGVTEIRIYPEPGDQGLVPWIAIYKHGQLFARVNAKDFVITYAEEMKSDESTEDSKCLSR